MSYDGLIGSNFTYSSIASYGYSNISYGMYYHSKPQIAHVARTESMIAQIAHMVSIIT